MKTEDDFIEWLSGALVYVNYARYAQFGKHGFVCVGTYDYSEEIAARVDDLDGGDEEALSAAAWLRANKNVWIGSDPDPSVAMANVVELARRYYFDVLNGSASRT